MTASSSKVAPHPAVIRRYTRPHTHTRTHTYTERERDIKSTNPLFPLANDQPVLNVLTLRRLLQRSMACRLVSPSS